MRTHTLARHCLIAIALSATSTGIYAQALEQQYAAALANDNNLAASIKRHASTEQLSNIASAAFRPTLSGSYTDTYDIENNSNSDSYSASLALNLLVPAYHAKDGSEASIKQSAANLKATETSLIANTINNYFAVVKQQIQIESIKTQIKSAEQSLATIRKQRELGLATDLQAANVENNVQQLHLSHLQLQQALQQARNTLSLSTGAVVSDALPGIGNERALPELANQNIDHWWSIAQQNSPSLLAQGYAVDKAYHDYKQADAGKYPSGRVSLNHYSSAMKNDDLVISISGNFYDGGLNKAQTQQARLNWQANQETLQNLQDNTKQQLDNLLFMLQNNSKQIELQNNLLASAKSSLLAVEKEYQLGVNDLVAVLEAQQALASAEVNLANSRYERINLQVSIKQTAGTLTRADLMAIDQLLD